MTASPRSSAPIEAAGRAPASSGSTTCRPGSTTSRYAVFSECPHCAGAMAPEHAHYRCQACGWRDSCCD